MKVYDLHTHSLYSDGATDVEYMLEKIREKGYDGLGVSDHIMYGGMDTVEDVKRYQREVRQKPVFLGGEINMGEELRLPDSMIAEFDYTIGSVHMLYGRGKAGFPEKTLELETYFVWRNGEGDGWIGYDTAYAADYLERVYRQTEEHFARYRTDILGHCTVVPFVDDLGLDSSAVKDWERATVALCRKYGAAMEISGLWGAPYEGILRLAKQEGVKFSFGCDCHDIGDVANLDYALSMAETLGLTDDDLFIPVRKA